MSAPTVLDTDNAGVLSQSTKTVNHSAAKHYRISQAYIRDKVKSLMIWVCKVATGVNASDMFTKPLARRLFEIHKAAIMEPQGTSE